MVPCAPPVLADGYEFDYNLTLWRLLQQHLMRHTHIDTYDNIEKLDGDDLINATRLLKRQKRQLEAILRGCTRLADTEALKD